jgi:hypothetical protein
VKKIAASLGEPGWLIEAGYNSNLLSATPFTIVELSPLASQELGAFFLADV